MPCDPHRLYLAFAVMLSLLSCFHTADAGSPEAVLITGEILDTKAQPIEGADVWLVLLNPVRMKNTFVHARTDSAGRFQVRKPVEKFRWPQQLATEVSVVIHKPGFNVQGLALFPKVSEGEKAQASAKRLRLVLEPAQSAMVKVEQPDGMPLADAEVKIQAALVDLCFLDHTEKELQEIAKHSKKPYRLTSNGHVMNEVPVTLPLELGAKLSARTNATGQAIIQGVTPGKIGQLLAQSREFGTQSLGHYRMGVRDSDKVIDLLRLKPVGSLQGQLQTKSPDDWRRFAKRGGIHCP
jgi:hypothetical protein